MKIAFLFIAEPYQSYHGYPVALKLSAMAGVSVDVFYHDPDSLRHYARLAEAYELPLPPAFPLKRSFMSRLLRALRITDPAKNLVMADNRNRLMGYDAIVAVEKTVSWFGRYTVGGKPVLCYIPHGSGDRAVAVQRSIAEFDLVLPTGKKTADRFIELGLVSSGGWKCTGYIKLEAAEKLGAARGPLFDNGRPVVLYNPHKARGLSSWAAFIEPMIASFEAQHQWSLIVAPHVKMFRGLGAAKGKRWNARSKGHIIIDTGSDKSLDNTYTVCSDIYIGDVSSQVYEFLARPRPCIFLNPHRIAWRDSSDFLFWHLGEVIERPEDLMPAIERAHARHADFLPLQITLAAQTLGPFGNAAEVAATAIRDFVRDGRIDP